MRKIETGTRKDGRIVELTEVERGTVKKYYVRWRDVLQHAWTGRYFRQEQSARDFYNRVTGDK